jgi:predicted TIM-barrel fold metal-dependent hydrolase
MDRAALRASWHSSPSGSPSVEPEAVRHRLADGAHPGVNELISTIALVDHHVHSIVTGRVDRPSFLEMLTESDRPASPAATGMDSQVAIAVRRWCAPLLGMPAHVPADEYLERRLAASNEEASAPLLRAAGFSEMLVDSGYRGEGLLDLRRLGEMAAARVEKIVRLETLAERVATSGVGADSFVDAFRAALEKEARGAVGLKSIIAYRCGLDFDSVPPSAREVAEHAGAWLREIETGSAVRLADPVLLRFVLWEGVAIGKPLQVHTGYGDTDLDLHRSDPLLLSNFLRATEQRCPVMLLHTYPFQRNAGYLAQMFPHVFMDVGLAVNYAGPQSRQIVAESLEVAPFTKVLFSSDAWGLPELHLLGSWLFRRAMSRVIGSWVARDDWSFADAERVIGLVCGENARRVYRLSDSWVPEGSPVE